MDCDTTGVEPDFALVKFKKLAGGGYFKIANQSIEPALQQPRLLAEQERTDILTYVLGTLTLDGAPHINRATLKAQGLHRRRSRQDRNRRCPASSSSASPSAPWSLGEEALARLGVTDGAGDASPASTCSRTRLQPRSRSTRPTSTSAAP